MKHLFRYKLAGLTLVSSAILFGCSGQSGGPNPSGTLEATEIEIASELPARVLEVRKDLGDAVTQGDTLVVLDTRLLSLQRAHAEAQRGALSAQQAVAADAARQAKQSLDLAATTLKRNESMFEQGSVTEQQLDELRTKRELASAQWMAARHQQDALASEELKLDASLQVFDRQIEMGVIEAPLGGTVVLRNSEPGEMAMPGATLLKVADLQNIELRIFLSSQDLATAKIGSSYPVLVDALSGDTLQGTLTWISSEAEFTPKNAQTRDSRAQLVYAVKLRLDNSDRRLAIGMPAEMVLAK